MKLRVKKVATMLLAATVVSSVWLQNFEMNSAEARSSVTVAFFGDQGTGKNAKAVLKLIKNEGVDLVLHLGDFDYRDDPKVWDAQITRILGADFPVFATVGNHDVKRWYGSDGYQAKLQARLNRIDGARCSGDLGVRSACTYRGLFFILSGIGTIPDEKDDSDHIAFLYEELNRSEAPWKICVWHKNQHRMQTGRKKDAVGWAAYETCREAGAIIATSHEHSYARTHLLDNFQTQSVASTSSTLRIGKGRTFAIVSGLGGRSIRKQREDGPWWAAVYTRRQDANYGALFCTFFMADERNKASCYFKDIDGTIPDRFDVISETMLSDRLGPGPKNVNGSGAGAEREVIPACEECGSSRACTVTQRCDSP